MSKLGIALVLVCAIALGCRRERGPSTPTSSGTGGATYGGSAYGGAGYGGASYGVRR